MMTGDEGRSRRQGRQGRHRRELCASACVAMSDQHIAADAAIRIVKPTESERHMRSDQRGRRAGRLLCQRVGVHTAHDVVSAMSAPVARADNARI